VVRTLFSNNSEGGQWNFAPARATLCAPALKDVTFLLQANDLARLRGLRPARGTTSGPRRASAAVLGANWPQVPRTTPAGGRGLRGHCALLAGVKFISCWQLCVLELKWLVSFRIRLFLTFYCIFCSLPLT